MRNLRISTINFIRLQFANQLHLIVNSKYPNILNIHMQLSASEQIVARLGQVDCARLAHSGPVEICRIAVPTASAAADGRLIRHQ